MKNIDKIVIGSREYDIVWDQEDIASFAEDIGLDEDECIRGIVNHTKRKICLSPDRIQCPEEAVSTLIHEAMHTLEPFIGREIEHEVIDALANNMTSMLIQSKIIDLDEITISGVDISKL